MNYKQIKSVFARSDKMQRLAAEVLSRVDPKAKKMSDELVEALDAAITWNEDRWAVVAYYSTPENPTNYDQACCLFLDDLTNCI